MSFKQLTFLTTEYSTQRGLGVHMGICLHNMFCLYKSNPGRKFQGHMLWWDIIQNIYNHFDITTFCTMPMEDDANIFWRLFLPSFSLAVL